MSRLALASPSSLRCWMALGVIALIGITAPRPALAQARPPGLAALAPTPNTSPSSPSPVTSPLQAPPHQSAMVHRKRPRLIAGGAVIFGLSWVPAVVLSAAMLASGCCHPSNAITFSIPIIGPMAAGPSHDSGIFILWSAAQLGGAVMLVKGIKGEDVPADRDVPAAGVARRGPTLHVAPMLARDAGGMALTVLW